VPVAIVGGGIGGLSAAWWLEKRGCHDFVLLELEDRAGGNARWGENEVSAYPGRPTICRSRASARRWRGSCARSWAC